MSVNQNKVAGVPTPQGTRTRLIEAAKSEWPQWEQDLPLLVLVPDTDKRWRGVATARDQGLVNVAYDRRTGMMIG